MKILRIDHIAVCVEELAPALNQWQTVLGLLGGPREYVPSQLTDAAFLLTPAQGEACLELIAPSPRGKNAGLEKFLEKRGGLHHIAFAVDELDVVLAELAVCGVELINKKTHPKKIFLWSLSSCLIFIFLPSIR